MGEITLKTQWVLETYRRYARYYDAVFGTTLSPGRKQLLRRMEVYNGDRVLEIGVGTGLSLPHYPPKASITGIDLSESMLEVARKRVTNHGLRNVRLHVKDGEKTGFPTGFFDVTVAMYVVSVTPDPGALVREMFRLTKPGGRIYVLNHFSRKGTWTRGMESLLQPIAPYVGFEPLFPMEKLLAHMDWEGELRDHPVHPFGYWRILEYRKAALKNRKQASHVVSSPRARKRRYPGATRPLGD